MAYQYYYPNFNMPNMAQPQPVQNQGFNWVSGEAGAKSWIVGRGESALLLDSENPVFYIKSSDVAGMPLPLRILDYKETVQEPSYAPTMAQTNETDQFVTREEYNSLIDKYEELKGMLDNLKPKGKKESKDGKENE